MCLTPIGVKRKRKNFYQGAVMKDLIKHTNRFRKTYYLHAVKTKKGNTRYVMKPKAEGASDRMPEGYEIRENINGIVSVGKIKPRIIREDEECLVRNHLERLDLMGYRVDAKEKYLTVYEPLNNEERIRRLSEYFISGKRNYFEMIFSNLPEGHPLKEQFNNKMEELKSIESRENERKIREVVEDSRVEPIMRFILIDEKERLFTVQRMFFSGEGGWLDLYDELPLNEACEKYLPHLGKDSFFDLF